MTQLFAVCDLSTPRVADHAQLLTSNCLIYRFMFVTWGLVRVMHT